MLLKANSFRLFVLIVCFLDVKSDTSHLSNDRRNADVLNQFMQDETFRNNIITFLETPEEQAARENHYISQLRQLVDERVQRIREKREQLEHVRIAREQCLKDRFEESRIELGLQELLFSINQLRSRGRLNNQERADNRARLIQRLQDFIYNLDRTLLLYAEEKKAREARVRELSNIAKIEEIIEKYRSERELRKQEYRYALIQGRESFAQDLRTRDEIEIKIQTIINNLRFKHACDQPINDQHVQQTTQLIDHWKNLQLIITRIDTQRAQFQLQEQYVVNNRVSQEQIGQRKRVLEQNNQEQPASKRNREGSHYNGRPSRY